MSTRQALARDEQHRFPRRCADVLLSARLVCAEDMEEIVAERARSPKVAHLRRVEAPSSTRFFDGSSHDGRDRDESGQRCAASALFMEQFERKRRAPYAPGSCARWRATTITRRTCAAAARWDSGIRLAVQEVNAAANVSR